MFSKDTLSDNKQRHQQSKVMEAGKQMLKITDPFVAGARCLNLVTIKWEYIH